MPTTETVETVDLSLCQPGDVCHLRNGKTSIFAGPSDSDCYPFMVKATGEIYMANGRFWTSRESDFDIIRVERTGTVVTPVAAEAVAKDPVFDDMVSAARRLADLVTPAPAPAAETVVITGPGRYLERVNSADDDCEPDTSEIVGQASNGQWLGIDSSGEPSAWNSDGTHWDASGEYRITGPYVAPPEPPRLTITEKARVDAQGKTYVIAESVLIGEPDRTHVYLLAHASVGVLDGDEDILGAYLNLSDNGLFICEASDWPRVQELVAAVNAVTP